MNKFTRLNKFVEFGWLLFSSIATVSTGLISNILSTVAYLFDNKVTGIIGSIFSICFYFALSLLIIQMLAIVYIILNRIREIQVSKKNVVASGDFAREKHLELEKLLDTGTARKIKIICYGTSGYGQIIQDISTAINATKRRGYKGNRNSKKETKSDRLSKVYIETLVCCPKSSYCIKPEDKNKIEEIAKLDKKDKIDFTYSCLPPTIRACIVYNSEDEAIWAWMSIYAYEKHPNAGFSSAGHEEFFSFFGDHESPDTLRDLVDQIEAEFERLKQCTSVKRKQNSCDQTTECQHCRCIK